MQLQTMLHHFSDTVTYCLQSQIFHTPSQSATSIGVTPFKFAENLYRSR